MTPLTNTDRAGERQAKPVETFWLERDPLTGEPFEAPTYRRAIPVYDAETRELREFLP